MFLTVMKLIGYGVTESCGEIELLCALELEINSDLNLNCYGFQLM